MSVATPVRPRLEDKGDSALSSVWVCLHAVGVPMCEFTLMSASTGAPDMDVFALRVFAE